MKCIWGEVKSLDVKEKTATIKPIFFDRLDTVSFDYCMIYAGCTCERFHSHGESLWFPTIHEEARKVSSWSHIDERFTEDRRRHILEEYTKLQKLEAQEAKILGVGAGFIGVEWVKLTIIDFLPMCLRPLPHSAADYCSDATPRTRSSGRRSNFPAVLTIPTFAQVKSSNYFMPKETLSEKGPGGGGWIIMNKYHLAQNDYSFDALQAYCFRINM